jgi:acetyl esterase/lipase
VSLSGLVGAVLAAILASGLPMRLAGWLTPRAGTVEIAGLRYAEGARGLLELTLPAEVTPRTPLVVFFHGGSWQTGARGHYAFLARALAAEGIAVAVPDYRLWPEGRWPDFLRDGAAAVAWLRSEAGRAAGAPAGPVSVMGHSAGGFIAAALALDPRWLEEAGLPGGRGTLAGGVLVSAPIAWQPTDEPIRSIFAGAPGGRIQALPDPAALAGAPPLLLIHGTADTVVGPFHSERLAEAVLAAGGTARLELLDGAGHIAPIVALSEPARRFGWATAQAWAAVLEFLRGASRAP